MGVNEH